MDIIEELIFNWYNVGIKIKINRKLWRYSLMKWYNDMTEQETRSFRKVIVVCTVGVILILIVPMVFHAIF